MEEVLRSEIWWSMIMGFLQQKQESQRDEKRQKRIVDELFMMISCRLLLLGVHGTFLHFCEWWTRSLVAQLLRSCREHGDRHTFFVISIIFFLLFDDEKLIEFFPSAEKASANAESGGWTEGKLNQLEWWKIVQGKDWFRLKCMSINQNEFLKSSFGWMLSESYEREFELLSFRTFHTFSMGFMLLKRFMMVVFGISMFLMNKFIENRWKILNWCLNRWEIQ